MVFGLECAAAWLLGTRIVFAGSHFLSNDGGGQAIKVVTLRMMTNLLATSLKRLLGCWCCWCCIIHHTVDFSQESRDDANSKKAVILDSESGNYRAFCSSFKPITVFLWSHLSKTTHHPSSIHHSFINLSCFSSVLIESEYFLVYDLRRTGCTELVRTGTYFALRE